MADLLDMLGDEWALPDEEKLPPGDCKHPDRQNATHGCRESGRPALHWSEVGQAGYVDGMGRPAKCSYCMSCMGSGRTMIRDPWSGFPLVGSAANCVYCSGTGWWQHRWDCEGDGVHATTWRTHQPIPATHFGVAFPGRTLVPGEYGLPTDITGRTTS